MSSQTEMQPIGPEWSPPLAPVATRVVERVESSIDAIGDSLERAESGAGSAVMRGALLIASSPAMANVVQRMNKIAASNSTTLITGESGVGKSLVAGRIHAASHRASEPFVAVNCASLPRDLIESELFGHTSGAFTGALRKRAGRIEAANGGTLFLDEIGELPPELQPKLLTFLQDQTFHRIGSDETHRANVRIIAATNRSLADLRSGERFRSDLYYRLNVLGLHIPPLRERLDEIMDLAREILRRIAIRDETSAIELTLDAAEAMRRYDWPGNVRELENVLERAVTFRGGAQIAAADLEFDFPPEGDSDHSSLESMECGAIRSALEQCGGNRAQAAARLGISERSIYNKIKRFGL